MNTPPEDRMKMFENRLDLLDARISGYHALLLGVLDGLDAEQPGSMRKALDRALQRLELQDADNARELAGFARAVIYELEQGFGLPAND